MRDIYTTNVKIKNLKESIFSKIILTLIETHAVGPNDLACLLLKELLSENTEVRQKIIAQK